MEWIYSKDKAPSDPRIALDKEALSGRLLPFIASNIAGRKVYGRTAYFGYVDLGEYVEAPGRKVWTRRNCGVDANSRIAKLIKRGPGSTRPFFYSISRISRITRSYTRL